jgi:hypothetical protein
MVRLLIGLSLSLVLVAPKAWTQESSTTSRGTGPRKQIAIIMFAGVAGAVLGLSTLSFYGRPQDKLVNVPIGGGIGIIVGAIYTTYKAATQPREFMDGSIPQPLEPEAWQTANFPTPITPQTIGTSWQWTF